MHTLSDRVRASRKQAGLSQRDIAKALGISPSAVNQWEHGVTKNMKLHYFFALARLLGQDPQWLATGKGPVRGREISAMSPKQDDPSLTGEEKALLHQIRRLPGTLRKALLKFLRELGDVFASSAQPRR